MYTTIFMSYSPEFISLYNSIDKIMKEFSHTKQERTDLIRRTLSNGQWFDILDYKKPGKNIIRFGRGAPLVRQYPILYDLFDQVLIVVAKVTIHSPQILIEKDIRGIIRLLDQAPRGIGAFD